MMMKPIDRVTDQMPWSRMEGESAVAWRAFEIYRRLGPQRTRDRCAREFGKEREVGWAKRKAKLGLVGSDLEAKRDVGDEGEASPRLASTEIQEGDEREVGEPREGITSGDRLGAWVASWGKKYRWEERARAWDEWVMTKRDEAHVRVAEKCEWEEAKRINRCHRETLFAAEQLKVKALQMLQWDLSQIVKETRTESEDGHITIVHQTIEPAKWGFRDAAAMLKLARELEEAVFFPERSVHSVGNLKNEGDIEREASPKELAAAEAKLEGWRGRMQEHMLTMPTAPPGSMDGAVDGLDWSGDGGSSGGVLGDLARLEHEVEGEVGGGGNGHGNGNGNGNGHGRMRGGNGNGHGPIRGGEF